MDTNIANSILSRLKGATPAAQQASAGITADGTQADVRTFTESQAIGGAEGWKAGDVLVRATSATGYDESKLLGKVEGTQGFVGNGTLTPTQEFRLAAGLENLRYEMRDVCYGSTVNPPREKDRNREEEQAQTWKPMPKARLIVCRKNLDDTPQAVSYKTVTDGFGLAQPDSLDSVMDAMCERFGVGIDRGGLWNGGSVYWLQSTLGAINSPSGPVKMRMLALAGYDQSAAPCFKGSAEVAACRNVIRSIMRNAGVSWRFPNSLDRDARIRALGEVIAQAKAEAWPQVESRLMRMGTVDFSQREMEALTALALGAARDESEDGGAYSLGTRAKNKAEAIMRAFESADGAMPGTLWGAHQAMTHYSTHDFPSRASTRLEALERGSAGQWQDSVIARIDRYLDGESIWENEQEQQVFQHVRLVGLNSLN